MKPGRIVGSGPVGSEGRLFHGELRGVRGRGAVRIRDDAAVLLAVAGRRRGDRERRGLRAGHAGVIPRARAGGLELPLVAQVLPRRRDGELHGAACRRRLARRLRLP